MKSKSLYTLGLLFLIALTLLPAHDSISQKKTLLYVATPGIRNYVEYGGVGVLVFDADNGK